MVIPAPIRNCIYCNRQIKGRTDKKFCDDYCRNGHNNKLKSDTCNMVRNINNALRKNRRILAGLMQTNDKTTKTNLEKLLERGFQFKYLTHTLTNSRGSVYTFCYEYGYMSLDNNTYLLVKQKDEGSK